MTGPVTPRPPSLAVCRRGTVAAAAAGAALAAAQSGLDHEIPAAAGTAAITPVAALAPSPLDTPQRGPAPGMDGAAAGAAADAAPVTGSDLASLAKGAALGREAARRTARVADARSAGAPAAALSGRELVVQPVTGRVTSSSGPRWGTTHYGLDIANRIGTPIFAVSDGVVERSGPASGFGLWVVLRHPDGTRSVYGHINRAFVQAGDRVAAGDRIAEVGNRGQSTGPHLHLEIWDPSGTKTDPAGWLDEHGLQIRS